MTIWCGSGLCPQGLGSCRSRPFCRYTYRSAPLLQSWHNWATLATGVESRHPHIRELSTAGVINRHSTDIYIVRHHTQNLGKNGFLPPLDSLTLNSVTVIRNHMPFKIRKSCGVRICSICQGFQPQHLLGRNFIILFAILLAFSKAKPQQHNPIIYWTNKTDWMNELKTLEDWRRCNQKLGYLPGKSTYWIS